MSEDWVPGDLALCVANRLPPPHDKPSTIVRIGAIYTVVSVRWSVSENCACLGFAEVRSRGPIGDFHASAFRKIRPLTDEERAEFEADIRLPDHVGVPA